MAFLGAAPFFTAWLFLIRLSYTKVLRTVSGVLFNYSSITHLPSNKITYVWSVDANVPILGVKFIFLFITCLLLFMILLIFSIGLLFGKQLVRYKITAKFKPSLDAYQKPYKTIGLDCTL